MKKVIILLLVCVLLAVYPISNFSIIINENYTVGTDTADGMAYIEKMENNDINQAEKIVRQAEEIRNYIPESKSERVAKILYRLDKGKTTYKKVLKNVYFMGDSLINGLESYGILNEKRIYSKVSASLYHLEDNYKKVIKKEPEVIVLHYGLNALGYTQEALDGYIAMYSKCIKKIKKKLPETRIIVSSIFPVDRKVAKDKLFKRIKPYNKAMKNMCKKLKVEYLDNDPLFKEIDYCYGRDGIHLPESFYRDHWLKYLIKEKETV
ncbi:MAG: hypothetical protein IJB74_05300 [Clostridia bacterium]|nr:hypothetical protein [Clostridia bacterium]